MSTKRAVNPLATDPTRLAGVRREFLRVVEEGWEVLALRIGAHLTDNPYGLTTNSADYSIDKLKRFRGWLRERMDATLAGDRLIEKYISLGFEAGLSRSHSDGKKTGHTPLDADPYNFKSRMRGRGATVEKVKLLASRTFSEMENVNSQTATRMSRILADGLVTGKTPEQVAREIHEETDVGWDAAKRVARTELTRAHAEGQLAAMDNLGVNRTRARLEFKTDGTPCPQCAGLEGKVYSLRDASGVIPVHPNCNCVWMPLKG